MTDGFVLSDLHVSYIDIENDIIVVGSTHSVYQEGLSHAILSTCAFSHDGSELLEHARTGTVDFKCFPSMFPILAYLSIIAWHCNVSFVAVVVNFAKSCNRCLHGGASL